MPRSVPENFSGYDFKNCASSSKPLTIKTTKDLPRASFTRRYSDELFDLRVNVDLSSNERQYKAENYRRSQNRSLSSKSIQHPLNESRSNLRASRKPYGIASSKSLQSLVALKKWWEPEQAADNFLDRLETLVNDNVRRADFSQNIKHSSHISASVSYEEQYQNFNQLSCTYLKSRDKQEDLKSKHKYHDKKLAQSEFLFKESKADKVSQFEIVDIEPSLNQSEKIKSYHPVSPIEISKFSLHPGQQKPLSSSMSNQAKVKSSASMSESLPSDLGLVSTFCNYKRSSKFTKMFMAQELDSKILKSNIDEKGNNSIWIIKFSRDGKFLATGGQRKLVLVWKTFETVLERQKAVLEIDSDNSYYSGCSIFRKIPFRVFKGHQLDILDLSWSQTNFLLSSSMDKTVRLWHIEKRECLCCFKHSDFVTSISFHPLDERVFISGSLDCKLRLWSIAEKKVLYWNELPELITAVSFTPDGRTAIAGTFVGLCLFFETEGLKYNTQLLVRSRRGRNSKGSKITGIDTFRDKNSKGVRIIVTSNDSRVRVYNLRDKSLELKLKGNQNSYSQIQASSSEDGEFIISGSEDGKVYIWTTYDLAQKKGKYGITSLRTNSKILTAVLFAPNALSERLEICGDPMYSLFPNPIMKSSVNSTLSLNLRNDIIVAADDAGIIKVYRIDLRMTELKSQKLLDKQREESYISSESEKYSFSDESLIYRDFTNKNTDENPKKFLGDHANINKLDNDAETYKRKPKTDRELIDSLGAVVSQEDSLKNIVNEHGIVDLDAQKQSNLPEWFINEQNLSYSDQSTNSSRMSFFRPEQDVHVESENQKKLQVMMKSFTLDPASEENLQVSCESCQNNLFTAYNSKNKIIQLRCEKCHNLILGQP